MPEEIEEHVHHAKEPFEKVVAGTMAGIAALLAIVSVFGQHFNTEKLLKQQESSDQWAFYQAKNIRKYMADEAIDLLTEAKGDQKKIQHYVGDSERYKSDMEKISEDAKKLKEQSELAGERAEGFHVGEVFLEIAIVLSSLAILSKRKPFFYGGAVSAVIGFALAGKAYFVH